MEDDVNEIESWLQDPTSDAMVLLIDGMGGIGKTTIATIIFNSNYRNYENSCFLADINETSAQPGGLLRLQSQLLSTILKSKTKETIWNVREGTVKVTNAICNKKLLLVLDDVATSGHLEALLGPQKFCQGSKVIITTTHKELLRTFKVCPKVQSIGTLSMGDDIELFCLYAFHQDRPIEPYIIHTKLFVQYCMGLPLALKVLGSALHGNIQDVWEDTMCELEANTNPDIDKVLEISYETLPDDKDKDLFLHIACFFDGEKEDYIVKLLAECELYPVVGIKNLTDRSLLYVEYGRVKMHGLIKKMGRQVVRKESPKNLGERSRLWQHQDCLDVLLDHTGTKKVEGLMFDHMQDIKEVERISNYEGYLGNQIHGNEEFEIESLEKMMNLMLLQLDYVGFYGKWGKFPRKLRLLSWHGFSLEAIPGEISLEKLVVLDMSDSKLKHVWNGYKFIGYLKILNLSHSVDLIETPNFSGLPSLENLIMNGCTSLIKVCKTIECLEVLVLLDLTNCKSLRDLPRFPKSIVSLQMSGCPNLKVDGQVEWLDSVSSFSLLKSMELSYCNLVDNSFPDNWSNLVSLVYCCIDGNNVTSLPQCIQTLPNIQTLNVNRCPKIKSILGLPKSVDILYIVDDELLEKVQPARNSTTIVVDDNCPKLCEVEGRFKFQPTERVERKIIRYLGLESNASEEMKSGLKVLHEFGIFSTFVSEKQIPNSEFMYKQMGPQISFTVPSLSSRIKGFGMCAVLSQPSYYVYTFLEIEVYNKTKDLMWTYSNGNQDICRNVEKVAWLSLWRCGNLLEVGDEIVVLTKTFEREILVEECRINLIYEDDKELPEGERKEAHHVNVSNKILWTDRMHQDISDYVHHGKKHSFKSTNQTL